VKDRLHVPRMLRRYLAIPLIRERETSVKLSFRHDPPTWRTTIEPAAVPVFSKAR
jgi:hypothetical protein